MIFNDRATLSDVKITKEGYMVAYARVARAGIQSYRGWELGKPALDMVDVYRPEEEVFHADSVRSFSGVDMTMDHPDEMVDADNWKEYSVGHTGEEIMRDGEFLRIPFMLKDAAAVKRVKDGKNQLSVGYTSELEWKDGVTPDGKAYQATMKSIRSNHIAVVTNARGGDKLKIGDSDVTLKTVLVDGHSVEVSDAAAIAIAGLEKKLTDALAVSDGIAAKDAKIGELTASISTKDGEIAALTQQLKDAALTPAQINAKVAERSALIDSIKKVIPAFDGGDKTLEEIRKEVVVAKLGDAAKDFNDDAVKGAFATLITAAPTHTNQLADGFTNLKVGDAATDEVKAFEKSVTNLNAWRTA